MYHARVEDEFSAAHFLSHYQGKCERLHGHNYLVRLWTRGEKLNEGGMLVDFSLLKKILKEVLSLLDHSCLNDLEIFKGDSSASASSARDSIASDKIASDPSAERIAKFIFEEVRKRLLAIGVDGSLLEAIDVFENARSMARYEE